MAHLHGKPNKAPGARFSKDPETFRARRQIQNLLNSCTVPSPQTSRVNIGQTFASWRERNIFNLTYIISGFMVHYLNKMNTVVLLRLDNNPFCLYLLFSGISSARV